MLVRGAIGYVSLKGAVSLPWGIASGAVGTVILLSLVLAAIQQRGSDIALGVRRLVYFTLATYVVSGLVSFAVSIYIVSQLGPKATSQAIMDSPALRTYELFDLIGFWVLGCTGL